MKQDITRVCFNCNSEFVWTAGEQTFMEGLKRDGKLDRVDNATGETITGEVTPPKRCPDCRHLRKASFQKNGQR